MKLLLSAVALLVGCALAGPAAASIAGVNNLAALGANDHIVWSEFGGDGAALSTPEQRLSPGGHTVGAHASDGVFRIRVEGTSHSGGFTPGTYLLTHEGTDDRVNISFDDQSVRGVGFHIVPLFTGAFTATLVAHASDDTILGSADFPGVSSATSDGSAPFAGLLSDSFDIAWVEFHVTQPPGSIYAIGANLAIDTAWFVEPSRAVPEPGTLLLLGGALFLFGLVRTRSCA